MHKIGFCLIAGAGLAACNISETSRTASEPTQICVDQRTMERVPDSQCTRDQAASNNAGSNFIVWYYLLRGNIVPPVGARVAGGTTRPVDGVRYRQASSSATKSQPVRSGGPSTTRSSRPYTPPPRITPAIRPSFRGR